MALGLLAPPALAADADATPPDGAYRGFIFYGGIMQLLMGPGTAMPSMTELIDRVESIRNDGDLLAPPSPVPVPDSVEADLAAVLMRWSGSALGPVDAVITDGNLDGSWSIRGWGELLGAIAIAFGSNPTRDPIMAIGGQQTTVARGRLTGPVLQGEVVGEESTETYLSIEGGLPLGLVDELGTTTVTTGLSEPLHDVIVGCNVLTARFDHDIRAGIHELGPLGFDERLAGLLVLVRTDGDTDRSPPLPPLAQAPLDATFAERAFLAGFHGEKMAALGRWAAVEMASVTDACPNHTAYLELTAGFAREQVRRVNGEIEGWQWDLERAREDVAHARAMAGGVVPAVSSGIGTTDIGRAELAKTGEAIHKAINDMEATRGTEGARTYLLSMVAHLRLDEL